jgi:hypothetical protein
MEATYLWPPWLTGSSHLRYQGEANSDEGYHRDTAEYACEFTPGSNR